MTISLPFLPQRRTETTEDGGRRLVKCLLEQSVELAETQTELKAATEQLKKTRDDLEALKQRAARAATIAEMNWDSGPCHSIWAELTPPRRPSPRPRGSSAA